MSGLGNKEIMARNLSYYVQRSGRTQKEICDIIGVPTSTMNNWIKGLKYPRIDKIEMLANLFHILKSDLIEDKTEEHRQMQKNNSTIADAVVRMRTDESFTSIVSDLMALEPEQLTAVKQLLSAFHK